MNNMLDSYLVSINHWFKTFNVLEIITTIVIAFLLCKAVGPIVNWISKRIVGVAPNGTKLAHIEMEKRAKTLSDLFHFIINALIIITATYSVLTDVGINLAPVLASAGIAGVALGFGAQSIVKDILAGFFILLENQYRVGDVVLISGIGFPIEPAEGTVKSITLRKTTLRDRDGNVHIIPNGNIVEVVNRTLGYSRFRFTFAVQVDTDVNDIIDIVDKLGRAMAEDPKWRKEIVDAPHYDEVGQIGKEGLNVTVSGSTMPGFQWKVNAEFRKRLISELQKNNISIADVES